MPNRIYSMSINSDILPTIELTAKFASLVSEIGLC